MMADLANHRFYRKLAKGKQQVGLTVLGSIRAAKAWDEAMFIYLAAIKKGEASSGTKQKWRKAVQAKGGFRL